MGGHQAVTGEVLRAKRFGLARRVIELWAIGGGLLLVAVIVMNVYSLGVGLLFGKPLPGDFELVEMGIAVAVFAFLPYCQLTGAHVTADVFTERAGAVTKAVLAVFAAVIAVVFGAVLLWRMQAGLADQLSYGETTAIVSIPIWWAYVPIVASLVVLVAASLISLHDAWADYRGIIR